MKRLAGFHLIAGLVSVILGCGLWQCPAAFPSRPTAAKPAVPAALVTAPDSPSQISLSWRDASTNEDQFVIQRATDLRGGPGLWKQVATTASGVTNYADRGLASETRYWYRLRAHNRAGDSDWSNLAVTNTLSLGPKVVAAVAQSTNRIFLFWTPSVSPNAGFEIERAANTNGSPGGWRKIATVIGGSTNYTDAALSPGTIYWYRVRARGQLAGHGYSSPVSTATWPLAPTQLTAVALSTNRVDLAWKRGGAGETAYYVERASDTNGAPGMWSPIGTNAAGVTNYSDFAGSPNATFWYRVRAHNVGGESAYSANAKATTFPAAPFLILAYAGGAGEIIIAWNAGPGGAGGFRIDRASNSNGVPGSWSLLTSVGSTATSYTDSSLPPGLKFWYRLRAYNDAGDSANSSVTSGTAGCPISIAQWGSPAGVPPADLVSPVAIAAGGSHNLALKSDGTVVAWGENGSGQSTPPTNLTGVAAIDAGTDYSVALLTNGTLVGWGDNTYGQTTVPTNLVGVAKLAAGRYHCLVLLSNGSVVGWGSTFNGAASAPLDLTNAIAIAAGSEFSLAVRNNGTVAGWGDGSFGRTTPPTNLNGVVAVAAGLYHSLALLGNGTVVGWGDDTQGQATPPTNLTGVVAIAAGDFHSLALKYDGTIIGWGADGEPEVTPAGFAGAATAIAANGNHNLALSTAPTPPFTMQSHLASANQVDLSWLDLSTGEAGFKVQRALDNGASQPGAWSDLATVGPNVTNFSDVGVTTNLTYWYRVQSFDLCGASPFSYNIFATVSVPDAPYYLTPNVGRSNVVELSWYDGFQGVDGFKVERAPDIAGSPGDWTEISAFTTNNAGYGYFEDAGATASAINWYRVRAFNAIGDSPYSSPNSIMVSPPPPPNNLVANPFADRANLSWFGTSSGVGGFKIERAPDVSGSPGAWTLVGATAPREFNFAYYTYTDTNLVLNARYWYRVSAYNWVGDSAPGVAAAVTILPPAPPVWQSATVGSTNEVLLAWTESTGDQNGFKLERAPDTGGSPGAWTLVTTMNVSNVTAASYADEGQGANTTNWYRVLAFNALGNSLYSSTQAVAIVAPPAPLLGGSSIADRVYLSWNWIYAGDIAGFRIQRAPDAGGSPGAWALIATITSQSTYTDTGRSADTTYWYRVQAFNWVGDSPYSSPISVTIVPPGAPVGLLAAIGATNGMDLGWVDYGNDEDGFTVERAPDDGGSPGVWAEIGSITNNYYSQNFHDATAAGNTVYWYRVRAFNVAGLSGATPPVKVAVVPPPAPLGLSAVAFGSQVNLNWYENQNNYAGFKIERAADVDGDPGTWMQIAQQDIAYVSYASYADLGRAGSTRYWYRVRAFNWVGDSPYGEDVDVTIVPPAAPVSLSVSVGTTNQANLVWYDYTGDEDGFYVERAPDAGGVPGAWNQIAAVGLSNVIGGTVNYSDPAVTPNTTNWYRVRAFNTIGLSAFLTPASVKVIAPGKPSLAAAALVDTVNATANVSEGRVDAFVLERAPDAGGSPGEWSEINSIAAPNTLSAYFTDLSLTPGATYWYRARAINWIGPSLYSDPVSVTILPPGAPYNLAALVGNTNSVNLSWNDSYNDESGFRIERAPDAAGSPGTWVEIAVVGATNAAAGYFAYTDSASGSQRTNWYRVRAFNFLGNSAYSDVVSVPVMPPGKPFVSASSFANTINLSMAGGIGRVDGFKIERAPDAGGFPSAWFPLVVLPAPNTPYAYFTDTNRPANSTTWYRVIAFNWNGDSVYSDTTKATIIPPGAPYSLSVSVGTTNHVDLTWYDYYGDETRFLVERAPNVGNSPGTFSQIASVPATNGLYGYIFAFTDSNAVANASYWYRVRAQGPSGLSAYTTATRVNVVAPGVPSVSAYPYRDNIDVSMYDYSGRVDGFTVERAPNNGGSPGAFVQIANLFFPGTSYNDLLETNRTANTTYWYRVKAYNWVGASAYSPAASATIVPALAPTGLYAIMGASNHAELGWYSGAGDQDGYYVERAPDAGGSAGSWTQIATVPATNSPYTSYYSDGGVTANTTNWYRVRAFNPVGSSGYSDPVSVAFIPPGPPTAPSASILDSDHVNLNWFGTGGTIEGFKLERAPDASGSPGSWTQIVASASASFTSYEDRHVKLNHTYWYRVRAFNWAGDSAPGGASSVTIFAPAPPAGLKATPIADQINLQWTLNDVTAVGLLIERAPDAGGSAGAWTQIADINAGNTSYLDTGLSADATYWYRLRSYNNLGISDYSSQAKATIVPPTAPTNLMATNNWTKQIYLHWSADIAGVTGFKIERAPDVAGSPGIWAVIATNATVTLNYTDTGLELAHTYWYRVQSYGITGESPWSDPASATVVNGEYLRVMQWNIEKALGRQANNSYFAAQSVARIVNFNQPDVLLFCEVDAQGLTDSQNRDAIINWVTNNVPYLGKEPGVTFFVAVAEQSDGFNRNAAVSRYPIVSPMTYNDGLRGLHSFKVQMSAANALQVFHTHLKCCADDCTRKQTEAQFDTNIIGTFAASSPLPYLFAGDWNEDEAFTPVCPLSSTYHPISTIREGARLTEFIPQTIEGEYRTWSTSGSSPSIRFDYILSATNRAQPFNGYVFSSMAWANQGLYNGYTYDSYYASDHYCVFAEYFFPEPVAPFTVWQSKYFKDARLSIAAPDADPDGDGMSNWQEALAGTNPTNAASVLRITGVSRSSNGVSLTWSTAGGRTNIVQASDGLNGKYTDISPPQIIPGAGDTTATYLDNDPTTNGAARYYRIRVYP